MQLLRGSNLRYAIHHNGLISSKKGTSAYLQKKKRENIWLKYELIRQN